MCISCAQRGLRGRNIKSKYSLLTAVDRGCRQRPPTASECHFFCFTVSLVPPLRRGDPCATCDPALIVPRGGSPAAGDRLLHPGFNAGVPKRRPARAAMCAVGQELFRTSGCGGSRRTSKRNRVMRATRTVMETTSRPHHQGGRHPTENGGEWLGGAVGHRCRAVLFRGRRKWRRMRRGRRGK